MKLYSEDRKSTLALTSCGAEMASYPSLCFSANIATPNVAGGIGESWFDLAAFEQFLASLATLDKSRSGSASLESLSPNEFRLEFFALDRLGHLGVRVGFSGVHYASGTSFSYSLAAGFEIDPTSLPSIIEALRADVEQQRNSTA